MMRDVRDVAVIVVRAARSPNATGAQRGRDASCPSCRRRCAQSGIAAATTSASRCSGSLDYLQGGPFAFVPGLDAVGAWPPIRESHVEMDAAWALYEAWVAIQTGEVDSALVYGFGKSSLGDLHEIMTLQTDPYYVLPLWPSMVDMAALQASAYLEASGRDRARTSPRSRPARSATRSGNPIRGPQGRRRRRRRCSSSR